MGKNDFEIIGMDELLVAFAKLPQQAIDELKLQINESGAMLANKIASNAPVDTGVARKNIVYKKPTKNSKYPYKIVGRVTFKKEAAHIVPLELGHKLVVNGNIVGSVKGEPFMRETADKEKSNFASATVFAMNQILERWGE